MLDQKQRDFVARGEVFQNDVSCQVTVAGSYPVFAPQPVRCTIRPDMDSLRSARARVVSEQHRTSFRGETQDGKAIFIPDLRVTKYSGFRARDQSETQQVVWEGVAEFFIEGDLDEFDASDGQVVMSVLISPTPLADAGVEYVKSEDGTISIRQGQERRGICWKTALGVAELIDKYAYSYEDTYSDRVVTRIRRSQIGFQMQTEGVISPIAVLTSLEEELERSLWLLSFLGRKRIVWYEAELDFLPNEPLSRDHRRAIARREAWFGYQEEREVRALNMPVKQESLRDGLFQQLLNHFESSPYRSTIHQAIVHLLVASERVYMANQYTSVYTAFECLVHSLAKRCAVDTLMGNSRFKKLSRRLRKVIRCSVQDGNAAEGVIKKLPELRRRVFGDQLSRLLDKCSLDIAKLWPPGVDVGEEIKGLIKRRNIYLHQGSMEDSDAYVYDLDRLRSLVELWILKLLGCPEEAVNEIAIGRLVPVTSRLGHSVET